MVDSIDLIINRVNFLDFKHLKSLGISIKKYKSNGKNNLYNLNNISIEQSLYFGKDRDIKNVFYDDYGYIFKYKNIDFKYSKKHNYLILITHLQKLLNKDDVKLTDCKSVINILDNVIEEVFKGKKYYQLLRIDYAVDIRVNEAVEYYEEILNKYPYNYMYMKKKKIYEESIYLTNKTGQHTMNVYNKNKQMLSRKIDDPKYKGIIRMEVQNRPAKIKNSYKKYKIKKEIQKYFNKNAMERNYFKIIEPYFYKGDYYRKRKAKSIIDASNYSKSWKKKLKFLLDKIDEQGGIQQVYDKKILHKDTVKIYIEKLDAIGVNPITLSNSCPYEKLDNIVTLARRTAEEKYFN